jgi:hypothetical protein
MPYQDYIYLNQKLFQYISRDYTEFNIGGKIERSLDGTATQDFVCTKGRFTFGLELDSRQLARIKAIFNTHTTISLTDWDGVSYSTLWVGEGFSPKYLGEDFFNLSIELEVV